MAERWAFDDRAASSVIGVLLMVALVVVLAAIAGSFVLNQTDAVR